MLKNSKNEYNEDLYYKSGDTYNHSSNEMLNGCLTGGQKNLYFTVYVPKSMANISNVTVDAMTGYLRGVNGYFNSSSSVFDFKSSSYTILTNIVNDHLINVTISNSSTFSNSTNNTPVSLYCIDLSLSFS